MRGSSNIMKLILMLLDLGARPLVWLWYKTRNRMLVIRAGLPANARVLEIGSGNNPWPRSNVLCDRYPDDDTERAGKLKRDHRELIVADATDLPFKDKSFDFIYCSHVAEHIEDIGAFFREVQRVGKAGYIETPNYLFEQAVGTTTHVWALYIDHGTLVAQRKPFAGAAAPVYHGWHRALARHPILQACFLGLPELRVMQFWWNDSFSFRIEDTPAFMTATKSTDETSTSQ